MTNQATVERTSDRLTFVPLADIYETEKKDLVLLLDMPGVDEKSLDISLEKDILTIKGSVEEPKIEEGYRCSHAEYRYGNYERSFTLSDKVDGDKIEATIKNGVLKLTLPKEYKNKAKKINVKSE